MPVEQIITHPETGEKLHRNVRPSEIRYGGLSVTVQQPGWWGESGAFVVSQEDEEITESAFLELKARADKLRGDRIRKVRKFLKLTQIEASELFGGGRNAFQKYESGEVAPPRRLEVLLSILVRHPDELNRLRQKEDPLADIELAA